MSSPLVMPKPKMTTNRSSGGVGACDLKKVIPEDVDINQGYYIHSKKLGEGGFGSVKLATHLKTGAKVAVKIMDKSKLGNDLFRVNIEINALKKLNHKSIAKLFQVIETQDVYYLVLEYVSGGELFDYLVSKQRLSEEETRDIMRDLFVVLDYIHDCGFAHRDLKPENILFSRSRKIKLIDFGLSTHCRGLNETLVHLKTCCGSPAYAAPELLRGTGYTGPGVDTWSAGVLLYTLLVGKLPFDDLILANLYRKIQLGTYEMPDFLSKDSKNLISSMLQTDPQKRITIKEILKHSWIQSNDENCLKNESFVDCEPQSEEVLRICEHLFRDVSPNQLKTNIENGFGYRTATYRLILNNSKIYESFRSEIHCQSPQKSFQKRRSRSVSTLPQITETLDSSPRVVSTKRKIVFDTLKEFQMTANRNGSPNHPISGRRPDLDSPSQIPTPLPYTRRKVLLKDSVRKVRPITNDFSVSPAKSPRVVTANKSSNSCGHSSNSSSDKSLSNKSSVNALKNPLTTPSTPKKSFFKRLLETATPAKSQTPRAIKLSTSDSHQKNLTLTKFTEPKDCIERLIKTLQALGVQCTQKHGFLLRCVMSSMNTIVLAVNLEICKFEDKCVIYRKRLKGNSWDYKRICEAIEKI